MTGPLLGRRIPAGPARTVALVAVLAVLVAAVVHVVSGGSGGTRITAFFDRAVGLYPGSAVRVLGIQVGRVDAVVPEGGVVRVELTVDDVPVPPDASAVVVAPSLVSDRYVQLTPAYVDGPAMPSGTVIPRERTAIPVEIDELLGSIDDLSKALGPGGANATGALSDVLQTAAANLDGNGENLNTAMTRLGQLAGTLSDSRGDLFATIDNLQKFTATLAESDDQIRQFQKRLASVTGALADDREQVGASLHALADALEEVDGFIADNRELVASNVERLTGITKALVDQRAALAEVIDVAPLGATNFINAYDAASGSVAVRGDFAEFALSPTLLLCALVQRGTPTVVPPAVTATCGKLAPILDGTLPLPTVEQLLGALQQGKPPPLPLPLVDALTGGTR
ncbi:MCE family protein [Pseudonocardia sp. CA-107938]|uniref:MCE family protein n=1 Tax=Pseudonocardia sp. CA-107938 TaxID=3240021 RepID=UPI003D93932B